MKQLSQAVFRQIRQCLYRYARYVEITWWRCLFEQGSREEALAALAVYQNADGGFGHGLEPDCSNPASSPATTYMAYTRLRSMGCDGKEQPMIQAIMRYVEHAPYFTEHGWYWSIPSNNAYPCQPWYRFPNAPWFPEDWPPENYVNGGWLAFIFRYFDPAHPLYRKALRVMEYRLARMASFADFCAFTGEWHQESIEANDWAELLEAVETHRLKSPEACQALKEQWMRLVRAHAIPAVQALMEKRFESPGYSEQELDRIVDGLSSGNAWNDDGFLYDAAGAVAHNLKDHSERSMHPGELWWNLIAAVSDLQLLAKHGRISV